MGAGQVLHAVGRARAAVETDHCWLQTRQLESLIRMAEARARLDLRSVVTQQDAEVGCMGVLWRTRVTEHCMA